MILASKIKIMKNTKLANKIARQNAKTNEALIGYTVGSKTTRSRNSGFYKPTFVNRIKL